MDWEDFNEERRYREHLSAKQEELYVGKESEYFRQLWISNSCLKSVMRNMLGIIAENHMTRSGLRAQFRMTEECALYLCEGIQKLDSLLETLKGAMPKWVINRLEDAKAVLECFSIKIGNMSCI